MKTVGRAKFYMKCFCTSQNFNSVHCLYHIVKVDFFKILNHMKLIKNLIIHALNTIKDLSMKYANLLGNIMHRHL